MKARVLTLVFHDFLWVSGDLKISIMNYFLFLNVLSTWMGEPPLVPVVKVVSEGGPRISD